jgi:hypothetical protein
LDPAGCTIARAQPTCSSAGGAALDLKKMRLFFSVFPSLSLTSCHCLCSLMCRSLKLLNPTFVSFLAKGFFVQTPIIPIRFSSDLEFKLQPAQHD